MRRARRVVVSLGDRVVRVVPAGAPAPGGGVRRALRSRLSALRQTGVWDGAAGAGASGAAGGASGCAIGAEFIGTDGCVDGIGVWAALAAASAMERWNSVSPCAGVAGVAFAVLGAVGRARSAQTGSIAGLMAN